MEVTGKGDHLPFHVTFNVYFMLKIDMDKYLEDKS